MDDGHKLNKIQTVCILGNREKCRPDVFQVCGKSLGERSFLLESSCL